eukprot:10012947-Alexandrium_andersonii.AAC.1
MGPNAFQELGPKLLHNLTDSQRRCSTRDGTRNKKLSSPCEMVERYCKLDPTEALGLATPLGLEEQA